jgi:hypothetical protein
LTRLNDYGKIDQKLKKGVVLQIYKEKPGIISEDEVWVCIQNDYLYTAGTLHELIEILNTEWEDVKHFAGGYSGTYKKGSSAIYPSINS